MPHTLPDLPWAKDALAPHISSETIDYHYGKHHQAYVTKLNAAIEGMNCELDRRYDHKWGRECGRRVVVSDPALQFLRPPLWSCVTDVSRFF